MFKKKLMSVVIVAVVLSMTLMPLGTNAQTVSTQTAITQDMTLGSRGADVVALQLFLENRGFLVVPPGIARGYFWTLTQQAVMKFQIANGMQPTGVVDAKTRVAINAQRNGNSGQGSSNTGSGASNLSCPAGFNLTSFNGQFICLMKVGGNSGSGSSNSGSNSGNNSGSNEGLKGGETSLENFEVEEGDDDELEEGDSDAEVMEISFDVEEGDAEIRRVDIHFQFSGDEDEADNEPWEVFDSATLLINGKSVATMNTDDDDDWDEEDDDEYRLRFENLKTIVREGKTAKMTLELDVHDDVEGADDESVQWDLFVPDDGIRVVDGEGRNEEVGDEGETVTVEIKSEEDEDDEDYDEDDAEEAIEDAEDAIKEAEDEIDDADEDGKDTEEAEELLEEAEELLEEAEEAFDDEDWDEAVELAEEAMELADEAIDAIED
jgi:hypothetical protein